MSDQDERIAFSNSPNPIERIASLDDMGKVLSLKIGDFGLLNEIYEADKEYSKNNPWLLQHCRDLAKNAGFGSVYMIEGTHNGAKKYKIGKANVLSHRMKTFEVRIPFDMVVVTAFYVKDAIQYERELHRLMSYKRFSGEWFDLTQMDIFKITLHGLARESRDMGDLLDTHIAESEKSKMMNDQDYIEYLESILVFNEIKFSRVKAEQEENNS